METVRLGRTNLKVGKIGFGALPIQRIGIAEARRLLIRALEGGVNFIDTARLYTDSEKKIGASLSPLLRTKVVLASKVCLSDARSVEDSLHESLRNLRTEYLDFLQFHNPPHVPAPGDADGSYNALFKARRIGKIRFIGISTHSAEIAVDAVQSGLYDTLQFPFSHISSGRDKELPYICCEADVGFLAMKPLGGGLIRNIPAAFAFMSRHNNVLPLWGIQKMEELEEFLALDADPPVWDTDMEQRIQMDILELGDSFCRACGYCMPCPAGIDIPFAARAELLLKRAPVTQIANAEGRRKIADAENCTNCGECRKHCPYDLDTPALVRRNVDFFNAWLLRNERVPD